MQCVLIIVRLFIDRVSFVSLSGQFELLFITAVALQNTYDSVLSEIDLFFIKCEHYC